MAQQQLIQEANEIESVSDEANGGRYVFVSPKRLRAIRKTEDIMGGAPARRIEDRPTTKMARLERPELPTVKMPQLSRHPDPQLCECERMYEALRHRVIDVAYLGPAFLVPLAGDRDAQAPADIDAVRHCPFDGTLMDASVEIRPYAQVEGELPCCCGAMADQVRAQRIEIPAFKVGYVPIARLRIAAPGPRLPILHCPFCGVDTIDTILARHKRHLGLQA